MVKENGNEKDIIAYAFFDKESSKLNSCFSTDELKKMQDIHERGRFAPHEINAAGYKCFNLSDARVWEFKISGKARLYGLMIESTREGKRAGVAPLVVFDQCLRKKR